MAGPTPPRPPAGFDRLPLPIRSLVAGSRLVRGHPVGMSPLFFSVGNLNNRFDDPEYGVCYAALTVEAAFVECFCRDPGLGIVHEDDLLRRSFSHLVATRDLRLAELDGPGLVKVGATAAVVAGAYADSRPWGRAIWAHPERVDGIFYASRHDNRQICLALFDRCRAALVAEPWRGSLIDDPVLLGGILDGYGLALDV